MKADLSRLAILAYAHGFTLWVYKKPKDHTADDLWLSGYFNDAPFEVSDMVLLPVPGALVSVERTGTGEVTLSVPPGHE